MSSISGLGSSDLDNRLASFQAIINEGKRYQPGEAPTSYTRKLQQAAELVERELSKHEAAAKKDCGFFSLGCKSERSEAQELLPSDKMFRSTMAALSERYGNASNRAMGKHASAWEAQMSQHAQAAGQALEALRGGDSAAAGRLQEAVAAISSTAKAAVAEKPAEERAIAGFRAGVDKFTKTANDTGVFNKRKKEKAALAAAREVVSSLNQEISAQAQLAQSAPSVVRPFVTGQLESDPSFADRGYVPLKAESAQWNPVIEDARSASSAAGAFSSAVSEYGRALDTAATAPGQIESLEQQLTAARADLDAKLSALQTARAEHAAADRVLRTELSVADRDVGDARVGVRRASNIVGEWNDAVRDLVNQRERIEGRISSLERQIRDAQNSGGNQRPGSGGGNQRPGSGGNSRPGSSGNQRPGSTGNSRPGSSGNQRPGSGGNQRPGSGQQSGPSLSELRGKLRAAQGDLETNTRELRRARRGLEDAETGLANARIYLASTEETYNRIVADIQVNDSTLAAFEGQAADAQSYHDGLSSDLRQTREALAWARENIATAEGTIGSLAESFNGAVAAFQSTTGDAAINDEGRGQLGAQGLAAQDVAQVVSAVRAQGGGFEGLAQRAQAATTAAQGSVQVATSQKQGLEAQMKSIVDSEVAKALR